MKRHKLKRGLNMAAAVLVTASSITAMKLSIPAKATEVHHYGAESIHKRLPIAVNEPAVMVLESKENQRRGHELLLAAYMPFDTVIEPDDGTVMALSKTLYGECRGCDETQQKAVAWCILNRVDSEQFPDTVIGVVSQPYQFAGYDAENPVLDNLREVAKSVLLDWQSGGKNRVLPSEYLYFTGNGKVNQFTIEWGSNDYYDFGGENK